jgi:hypothetical protein
MMSLKNLLVANAIAFGISGLVSIMVPSIILSLWGIDSGSAALLTTQYAGVGSIGIALLSWFSRNVEDSQAQRAIILSMLITYPVGLLISVIGIISGVMKTGWFVAGIFLLFATGFAYLQFSKKK